MDYGTTMWLWVVVPLDDIANDNADVAKCYLLLLCSFITLFYIPSLACPVNVIGATLWPRFRCRRERLYMKILH